MSDLLILNFEGEDGATSWVEEAQSLEAGAFNAEIDTDKHYSGSSSLRMFGIAQVDYNVGVISSGFTFVERFQFHSVDNSATLVTICNSAYETATVQVSLYEYEGFGLSILVFDKDGESVVAYDELCTLAADVFHKLEVIVAGSNIVIKIDDVEYVNYTSGKSNPLAGLWNVYFQNYTETAGNDLWIDSVALASSVESIAVPVADITFLTHEVDFTQLPLASITMTPLAPDFGPVNASVPTGILTMLPRVPAYRWSVPDVEQITAKLIYRCILTGVDDGLADVVLPMSSFQMRLRDGDPSYLSCVIPDSVTYEPYITARTNGDIVIQKGYVFSDGTEQMEEIARVNYESIQVNRGANNDSLILTGYKTVTSSAVADRTISGVSFYALQADGKRRVRGHLDLFLRCGDNCIYGTGIGEYFTVGQISAWVSADPVTEFMEATEA